MNLIGSVPMTLCFLMWYITILTWLNAGKYSLEKPFLPFIKPESLNIQVYEYQTLEL